MNSKTQKLPPKKEAVGVDGLTKKERRALKVQTKQAAQNNVETAMNNSTNKPVEKPIKIKSETKTEDPNKQVNDKIDIKDNSGKLSEKELRKLEWEKKLSTEKQNCEIKEGLSKAEVKAKRREQQEAQRSAKSAIKPDPKSQPSIKESKPEHQKDEPKIKPFKKEVKKSIILNRVELVQHLYNEHSFKKDVDGAIVNFKDVHPAFIRLGAQYSTKTILGSNARCLALLSALKCLVYDLQTPPKQEFCRYLETILQTCTNHLQKCRPLAVSMTNALRPFKLQLTQIDTNLSDNEKRAILLDNIKTYIHDDIKKAGEAISLKVNEKITDGDVILIYACSSLIRKILLEAHKRGKKFEVIVVDGRPHLEGREMLRRLTEAGIMCRYVLISALSYVMGSASKILLGAHALLTNGYVMSRIGTAQVALIAQAYNKPVLVCCETYKFSERVQTDSFVYNEIDDEDKLTQVDTGNSPLLKWRENNRLTPLNLLYDVTPPDLVTAVVTELAILPCTSVPAVLRINAHEVL